MNTALYNSENDNAKIENEYLKAEIERLKKNNTTLISELYESDNKRKSSKSDDVEYRQPVKRRLQDDIEHEYPEQKGLKGYLEHRQYELKDDDIKFKPFKGITPVEHTKPRQEHMKTFEIEYEPTRTIRVNNEPIRRTRTQQKDESYKKKYFIIGLTIIFLVAFITSLIIIIGSAKKLGLVPQVTTKTQVVKQIKDGSQTAEQNGAYTSNIPTDETKELNQQISDLNNKNSDLENKQKTYESQISELAKKNENLYYPVKPSDKHTFGYVNGILKSWKPLMEYKENVYDCSNMSAQLQWFLEANDIKAKIIVGKPDWAKTTHAWVFAYGDFGKIAIEATTQKIVYDGGLHLFSTVDTSYYDDKNIYNQYDSIFGIPDDEKAEFEWWNITKGVK